MGSQSYGLTMDAKSHFHRATLCARETANMGEVSVRLKLARIELRPVRGPEVQAPLRVTVTGPDDAPLYDRVHRVTRVASCRALSRKLRMRFPNWTRIEMREIPTPLGVTRRDDGTWQADGSRMLAPEGR
jgi:hypothetical protein